jgi:hypothetical protein
MTTEGQKVEAAALLVTNQPLGHDEIILLRDDRGPC